MPLYTSLIWIYYSVIPVSSTFLGQPFVAIYHENAATQTQNAINWEMIRWNQAREEKQLIA